MKLRILDQEKVKKAISIQEAIQIVREIYKTIYRKEAVLLLRTQLSVEKEKGRCLFMPAFIPSKKALGTKIISIFPGNLRKKLPTVQALIMIMDDETGIPIALMDGAFITALRTGAASGVATELLARKSARVASIFGAGRQGKTQLEAVCAVREIQKAWIYDPDQKAAEALLKEIKQEGSHLKGEIQIADSSSQALSEADIICTATTSYRPVFSDKELKEGTHINGIGSFTPEMQEIPTKTVLRAKIVVDSLSACWKRQEIYLFLSARDCSLLPKFTGKSEKSPLAYFPEERI
ncbi:MAG: ornithine cyclodeaminase family protein [Acidobacteriota bacterium]